MRGHHDVGMIAKRAALACVAAVLCVGLGTAAAAIPDDTVKIGVLSDLSGPFADQTGPGSVTAAQMAAEDYMAEDPSLKVVVISADHQNKPDIGAGIVRNWLDRDGVDAVVDVPNSAVGLAVNTVIHDKNRTFLGSAIATSDLTGKFCQNTTVQWALDTWALGHAVGTQVVRQGGNKWYFLSFEYALGQALERDTRAAITPLGATVIGSIRHPLGTTDFSSYLLQVQSAGANVLGLADTGADAVNAVKQAQEFGVLRKGVQLAALFMQISDIEAIGLAAAQGTILSEPFYWDLDDDTRAWSRRFAARMNGRMPTADQAAAYSATSAYLHAVKSAGTIDGDKVIAELRRAPIQDKLYGTVTIRADGRAIHPMYVFRVKSPADSKGKYDDYTLIGTIPADQAFRPLADGGCPLVK